MPFRSQAQRRFLYAKRPDVAARFESETPSPSLPRRVPRRPKPAGDTEADTKTTPKTKPGLPLVARIGSRSRRT